MDLSATEIAVIAALGGSFIAGFFATINSFISKRSEEKRHFRELVVKTAADHWNRVAEISVATKMPPLSTYIIHTVQMCDLAFSKKLTAKNIGPKLEEMSLLMDAMLSHSARVNKNADRDMK